MEDKRKKFERLTKAGELLERKRAKTGKSMSSVARELAITPGYLSEVENGLKEPSDELLRKMSEVYIIDEPELFLHYGKALPLSVSEVISKYPKISKIFYDIKKKNLPPDEEDKLMETVTSLLEDFLGNSSDNT